MTVAVGLVGAGGIAEKHRSNLRAIDGGELVAVCDVDGGTARRVADEENVRAYTDHEVMHDAEELDAVVVCIPPFAHENEETLAAERGRGVFVEKPVALSTATAERVGSRLRDAGVVTQVGYALRYSAATERARELVDPDDLSLVEGRYAYPGAPESDWWRRRERSGGQVVEQSTHVYDAVRYLAGDVSEVHAVGTRRHVDDIDFPDTTAAVLNHENGVVSEVTSTVAAPEMEATVRLAGPALDLTLDPVTDSLVGEVDGERVAFESDRDAFEAELRAFVDAVAEDDPAAGPVKCDYADGARTLALTLAVNESLEEGRPVEVD